MYFDGVLGGNPHKQGENTQTPQRTPLHHHAQIMYAFHVKAHGIMYVFHVLTMIWQKIALKICNYQQYAVCVQLY